MNISYIYRTKFSTVEITGDKVLNVKLASLKSRNSYRVSSTRHHNFMDRKEFFSALGYSTGVLTIAGCLGACKKSETLNNTPAPIVDFTLDTTQGLNTALQMPGGYVYYNDVIVARTTAGLIIAVSEACPHQGTSVQYQGDRNRFYCPNHGQTFSNDGSFIEGPLNRPLKKYNVEVTGNMVHVTG